MTFSVPIDARMGQAQSTVEEARRNGQPFEKEYFRKEGSVVPILIDAATFEGNEEQGSVLRETQMQLAHANRVAMIEQFKASIAHEVTQPITAAVTNAQAALHFLDHPAPDLDEVRQVLGSIVREGKRASAVAGRIRNLCKKGTPRDERVDINAAIREVIELTRGEAIKSGVLVQTELVKRLTLVQGDRVELQQVVLNLILNALEAMSGSSEGSQELLITTGETDSGGVLISVRDSGPGLAPTATEHLFKAFHTTKPGGLGLGLSICRSIVEAHGGKLWASANSPRGTVFQFALPAHPDIASGSVSSGWQAVGASLP